MRRFRNPKFAVESLERKLNPSSVASIPVAAEVYVPAANATPDDDGGTDPDPPDGDGSAPPIVPTIPGGPPGPS